MNMAKQMLGIAWGCHFNESNRRNGIIAISRLGMPKLMVDIRFYDG